MSTAKETCYELTVPVKFGDRRHKKTPGDGKHYACFVRVRGINPDEVLSQNFVQINSQMCAKTTPLSKIDFDKPPKFALFGDPWINTQPIKAMEKPRIYKKYYSNAMFVKIIISEKVDVLCWITSNKIGAFEPVS